MTEDGRKEYDLVEFELPKTKHFIVLQQLNQEESDKRWIHVIGVDKKTKYSVGRSLDVDIKINDITNSTDHGQISFDGSHFLLEDHDSMYGTSVFADQVPLELDVPVFLQVGRSILNFTKRDRKTLI